MVGLIGRVGFGRVGSGWSGRVGRVGSGWSDFIGRSVGLIAGILAHDSRDRYRRRT